MIELVISGGQTGADQAGWRAARAAGIPTGGWMPSGFPTEAGRRPEFGDLCGAKEHPSPEYRDRTISNIGLADGTLLFGDPNSPGGRLLRREAKEVNHPVFIVLNPAHPTAMNLVAHIRRWGGIRVVNIAGDRESKTPGIGRWVEEYLAEVFRLINAADRSPAAPPPA